ncbi:MAG: M55 family metallopeptidase [Candidatus Cloacimonetes bacterium]|nr:M55 family metallopeptidase [Candidatus Cloacimonadota bacterium]
MSKRIYISIDYEGMAGITNWSETIRNDRYNHLVTRQINAFLTGFFKTHPSGEVVISDSHMNGDNIYWEDLIGNCRVVKGYPRNFYMVEGLNADYDGFVLLGYHAPVGRCGLMDHTYSSSAFYKIEINGKEMDEAAINTLMASNYKVPLRFLFADDAGVNWFKSNICSDVPALVSKKAISRFAAELIPFTETLNSLQLAGERLFDYQGFKFNIEDKYVCRISMLSTVTAYAVRVIPGVELIDERTIEFCVSEPIMLYRYLMTIIMVSSHVNKVDY